MAVQEIRVPDLEGAENVGVVEIYVQTGEKTEAEAPLISLESDKAVMDVPSPFSGTITALKISEGDTVSAGDLIAEIDTGEQRSAPEQSAEVTQNTQTENPPDHPKEPEIQPAAPPEPADPRPKNAYHATPSVRALARELGVDLARVQASGPKGRITREDVQDLVKSVMTQTEANSTSAMGLPAIPAGDFAVYGETEVQKLSRIQQISGPHLHRNWLGIPHVTQFEEADITESEQFRRRLNAENAQRGEVKISPLIFIIVAAAKALQTFADFNSSLNPDGQSVTRKKYIHIGIAADTPNGLVVPVIRDADKKGIRELAGELNTLSQQAREGHLKAGQLKGATFTISSLGGIGGTGFTPIINAPQSAILGISRSETKPVWNGREFEPRQILPFSVSYDHRIIDGAQGARFAVYLASLISDMRKILL